MDLIDDIRTLSSKHRFEKKLGRINQKTSWLPHVISSIDSKKILDMTSFEIITDIGYGRIAQYIKQLLTKSFDDKSNINISSDSEDGDFRLVKNRIRQYDSNQLKVNIYNGNKIQLKGIAGSGKTELLVYRLVHLYKDLEDDGKILFTCNNKILAQYIKKRMPDFFDIFKIDRQIRDDELVIMHTWGGENEPGLYYKVCQKIYNTYAHLDEKATEKYHNGYNEIKYYIPKYNFQFFEFGYNKFHGKGSFKECCEDVLNKLNEIEQDSNIPFKPMFDYIFIDESQDFNQPFFDLCKKISKKGLFLARDDLQNIYDSDEIEVDNDFHQVTLKESYRTNPKTLMFANALQLYIFEEHDNQHFDKIIDDFDYKIEQDKNLLHLYRAPNSIFDKVKTPSVVFRKLLEEENGSYKTSDFSKEFILNKIIDTVKEIKHNFPEMQYGDIAIIAENETIGISKDDIKNYNKTFTGFDREELQINLKNKNFAYNHLTKHLDCDIYLATLDAFKSKKHKPNELFICNKNNIKGLEFMFVTIVNEGNITTDVKFRNLLYMLITRAQFQVYLLLSDSNKDILQKWQVGYDSILKNNCLTIDTNPKQPFYQPDLFTQEVNAPDSKQHQIDRFKGTVERCIDFSDILIINEEYILVCEAYKRFEGFFNEYFPEVFGEKDTLRAKLAKIYLPKPNVFYKFLNLRNAIIHTDKRDVEFNIDKFKECIQQISQCNIYCKV